jgi:hypothetical protein
MHDQSLAPLLSSWTVLKGRDFSLAAGIGKESLPSSPS